jgi:hypothetical protein
MIMQFVSVHTYSSILPSEQRRLINEHILMRSCHCRTWLAASTRFST